MPDIKSALSAALNEWDDYIETDNQPEKKVEQTQPKPYLFKTTNNVTRSTFEEVRDNPGFTRKVILAKLETKGFKLASTTSILSQMIKQRLVREEDDGTLHANFKEYMPLKATSKPKVKVKAVKAVKAGKAAPIEAAPQPQARQAVKAERRVMDIEEWLSEVPLMQARLVYSRLKVIFEGDTK
jgi:hypothetical protein